MAVVERVTIFSEPEFDVISVDVATTVFALSNLTAVTALSVAAVTLRAAEFPLKAPDEDGDDGVGADATTAAVVTVDVVVVDDDEGDEGAEGDPDVTTAAVDNDPPGGWSASFVNSSSSFPGVIGRAIRPKD